jgi:chorismate mutase/prephenate dehydratase
MSDAKREIEELRGEIAKLDAQLLATIERRAKASRRIGELRQGHAPSLPLGDRAALAALVAKAGHDLPTDAVREIFRQIFAACTALELPVKVAYLAPEGGPAHAAARGRFGAARGGEGESSAGLVAVESTTLAIDEVARRRVEFAVVPLETRAEGPVQATITALISSDLRIVATLEESWELDLVNRTGNAGDIEKVVATAADRALCAKLLQSLGPKVSVLDVKSPLHACQLAVEDHGVAALAGESFAATLGLQVARKNVLDEGEHRVRYAVVGHRPSSRTGNDLTSFVFSVDDGPGALLDVLKQFAERGINLTKIHSRPADRESSEEWGYLFFVEVIGHATDRTVVTAFEDVKRSAKFFKVLGSYPAAS